MRNPTRNKFAYLLAVVALLAALVAGGSVSASAQSASYGGAVFQPPPPPPKKAKIVRGKAIAPRNAPGRVRRVIKAANRIVRKPYKWGGGHGAFEAGVLDSGYDCSGAVSYALRGGRFLRSPLPSGPMMRWGRRGPGRWITVYAHSGHAYLVVAGLRFDTSMRDPNAPGPRSGPRWSKKLRRSAAFIPRHPKRY